MPLLLVILLTSSAAVNSFSVVSPSSAMTFDTRATVSAAPAGAVNSSAAALDGLAERYWRHELGNDLQLRAQVGLPIETIRPITYANAQADAAFAQSVLDDLGRIDATGLDHDRWLTYRTLQYLAGNEATSAKYYWLAQQATPYVGGLQLGFLTESFATFKFESEADAARYVLLLNQYAAFVRSLGQLLRDQHAHGVILPVAEIDATQAVYENYARPGQADALVPGEERLQALTPAQRTALRADAQFAVRVQVVPAFAGVAAYLKGDYRSGAPTEVGLWQYPGGDAYYR
ncbi:MAG TPA: DUF885 family protein, partial [Candidatus Tumulicola sp.]|nr:DUF885 family protein [Candidatus Tumulicola sp.]